MNALHGHFRPEFLNRVDDIIVFRPLGKEQLVKIIELRLEDVRRLLADRKISIELTRRCQGTALHPGLRPELRRASAEARDPKAGAGSARAEDSRRRNPARRPHHRRCRQESWQDEVRSQQARRRKRASEGEALKPNWIVIPSAAKDLGVCSQRRCRWRERKPRSLAALGMTAFVGLRPTLSRKQRSARAMRPGTTRPQPAAMIWTP